MRPSPENAPWWRCFVDALRGVSTAFRSERNLRIHFALLVFAVVLGWWLQLSATEWIALVLCSALVVGAEMLNTGIEFLADALYPEEHPVIGKAKDVAAGAVLIAAVAAVIVGAILFLPKLWELFAK